MPSFRGSSQLRDPTRSLMSSALAGRFFTAEPLEKPKCYSSHLYSHHYLLHLNSEDISSWIIESRNTNIFLSPIYLLSKRDMHCRALYFRAPFFLSFLQFSPNPANHLWFPSSQGTCFAYGQKAFKSWDGWKLLCSYRVR